MAVNVSGPARSHRRDGSGGPEIVVVGGGIGGLAAAVSLRAAGWPVRVLERSARFGEIGAGIQLAPNATRILDTLGVLDRIRPVAVFPRRLVLNDALTGTELTALDLSDCHQRYGGPYLVLHRSDLLDALVQECAGRGVVLENEVVVTAAEDLGDRARVRCQDGRGVDAAAVICADGLHSGLRRQFSDDEPVCAGYVAYRGAVPMTRVRRHADVREVVAWIGPGLHFVQYPLRSGELCNQVAVFRSEAYRRGEADWGTPRELDRAFASCCGHVRDSLPALGLDLRWPMYDRLPIDTWVKGRIALLGDAAHPMLQYLAQGACQAIEDAAELARVLGEPSGEAGTEGGGTECGATERAGTGQAGSIADALLRYQEIRAPRTARVQRAARTWGEIWHVDGLAKVLRDELFRQRGERDHRHVEWLYGDGLPAGPGGDGLPAGPGGDGLPAGLSAGPGGTGPASGR